MGIINYMLRRTLGVHVKSTVKDYLRLRKANSEKSEVEIYTLVLEANRAYEKEEGSQFVFTRRGHVVDVSKFTSIRSLVHWMIMAEKVDLKLSSEGHQSIELMVEELLDKELGQKQEK